jgi:hypothetical protein
MIAVPWGVTGAQDDRVKTLRLHDHASTTRKVVRLSRSLAAGICFSFYALIAGDEPRWRQGREEGCMKGSAQFPFRTFEVGFLNKEAGRLPRDFLATCLGL